MLDCPFPVFFPPELLPPVPPLGVVPGEPVLVPCGVEGAVGVVVFDGELEPPGRAEQPANATVPAALSVARKVRRVERCCIYREGSEGRCICFWVCDTHLTSESVD